MRRFFEVDRQHVALAALHALAQEGKISAAICAEAIVRYAIEPEAAEPWNL